MVFIASTLPLTRLFSAVTKPASVRSCSFHQPYLPLNSAQMNISLTGVYSCTQGKRRAKSPQ